MLRLTLNIQQIKKTNISLMATNRLKKYIDFSIKFHASILKTKITSISQTRFNHN